MIAGVAFYCGMTGMGKSWKAFDDLKRAIVANGNPALIIDNRRDALFDHLAHQMTVDEVLELLYPEPAGGEPRRSACFTPLRSDDFERLMLAINQPETGGVNVLVDECYKYCNSHYISEAFSDAMRLWRQHRCGDNAFFITSQRAADLHGDGYSACTGGKFVFRPGDKDIEPVSKLFGIDEAELRALGPRQFRFVA